VARDLDINESTLGNWVNTDRRCRGDGSELGEDERAELARLVGKVAGQVCLGGAAASPGPQQGSEAQADRRRR
jgi:transposase-like protein